MGIRTRKLWFAVAALWGFAEATAFFMVPDVLLTAAVILFGLGVALRMAGAAAIAAALGGLLMMRWGANDIEGARSFLLSVPLLGDDLISRVSDEIHGVWPVHLTIGAITGAPYKIYAVEAGAAGVNPVLFGLVSVAARFVRFFLLLGLFSGLYLLLRRFGRAQWDWRVHIGLWALIYAAYAAIRLTI